MSLPSIYNYQSMLPVAKMRCPLPPHHWRRCTSVSALVLLTLLCSVCLTEQKIANVYENDDGNFQKLVLHEKTGAMFLGAQNRLYRLSLDLAWQQEVSLGPANDSHLCLNPEHNCKYNLKLRDEHVKLLLTSPDGDELLMCGNLYQGSCAKVAVHNVTQLTWVYKPVVGVETDAVFSSTAAIVTKADQLFVANSVNTHTSNHDENPLGTTRPAAPFLATRNYSTLWIYYSTKHVSSQMNIDTSIMFHAIHRFVFTYVDAAYFLVTRKSKWNSSETATFIGRTCQTDPGYRSYVEAPLSCDIGGIQFNFVEDAYIGIPGRRLAKTLKIPDKEELLFVTFSKFQKSKWDWGRHSGLCVYRLADIHRKLTQSIQNCFRGEGSTGPYHLAQGQPCKATDRLIEDDYCGGSHFNFPIASKEVMLPVISEAFPNTRLSAVTVSTIGPYTVVYLGTHSGNLLKVEVDSANIMLYGIITIQAGHAILPDMLLSSDGASLYAMTSSKVVRVEVQDCGSHVTCGTCMTSADPHCGWCSASDRCTAGDACQASIVGWRRTRTGRCPTIILSPASTTMKPEIQKHANSPMDLSFIVTIVTMAVIFNITFLFTIVATAISFIASFLIIGLCCRCQQKRNESYKKSLGSHVSSAGIPLTGIFTRNEASRDVEDVESVQTGLVDVRPPSVPMDVVMLESLLKDIMDPKLQETVKDAFIPRSRLTLHNIIGKGHFGCVYTGLLQLPEPEKGTVRVAIKTLHGQTLDCEDVELFLQEAVMMKKLDHPHVLRLLGVSVSDKDNNPLIILPYMARGDLYSYIKNEKKSFTWRQLSQLGQQVAEGMTYLAQRRIIHRDLAARNCMMDGNMQVKVADFGLSKEKEYYITQNRDCKMPVKWMALESLKESIFTTQSDVWSFGVLLWELMTRGEFPYSDVEAFDLCEYLNSGHRLKKPDICTQDIYILMSECWHTNPTDRPTFADLVNRLELILHQSPYINFRLSALRNRISQYQRK